MAVSATDLAAGEAFFNSPEIKSLPWISANIVDKQGQLVFSPHIIKQIGSVSIGIIGLTGPHNIQIPSYTITDWKTALTSQLSDIKDKCDFIIVLSNLVSSANKEISELYPSVHLVITADKKRGNVPIHQLNNTLFTQVFSRGKYLGKLDFQWSPLSIWKNSSMAADGTTNFNSFNAKVKRIVPSNKPEDVEAIVQQINKSINNYRQ